MRALRSLRHTAARTGAAAAVALVTACAPPPERDAAPDPDSGAAAGDPASASTTTQAGLHVTVSAGPARANAPLAFTLEVANPGDAEAVLDFSDGQRFDFEVIEDGTTVWRWAADMFFPQVLGRERVPAGESIEWSARREAGLAAGTYRVRGTLTTSPPVEVETFLTISEAAGDPPR